MVQQLHGSRNASDAQQVDWLEVEDVIERLSLPSGVYADSVKVGKRAKVEGLDDGSIGVRFNADRNKLYTIGDKDALRSFGDLCGVPQKVMEAFPQNVLMPMLNYAVKERDDILVVADEDNQIVSVSDKEKSHPIMPAEQVVENLFLQWPELKIQDAQLGKDWQSDILAITHDNERKLEDLLNPDLHQFLPSGGDPFRAGVRISHNPIGLSSPLVEPYLLRLVCRNGAVHAEYLHDEWGKGYGEGDELWHWFRDSLQQSNLAVDGVLHSYANMIGQEIPAGEASSAINGYVRDAHLSTADATAIRGMAIDNQPRNMYDLFNLATANATHSGHKNLSEMLTRQRRAASKAGNPDSHHRYCPTCQR